MRTQKEVFETTEGDKWFFRNQKEYEKKQENLLVDLLRKIDLSPRKVLEIGCSNGFQLQQIKEVFGCECDGVDPSPKAIEHGKTCYPDISLRVGTADHLPYEDHRFDTVIFGFCLYLCDRPDLFRIACEADRVLRNHGSVIITDFYPSFPFKNKYAHYQGLHSYKMNYDRMFTWNPAYTEIANIVYSHVGFHQHDIPNERIATVVLRKNEHCAYPEEPYRHQDQVPLKPSLTLTSQ